MINKYHPFLFFLLLCVISSKNITIIATVKDNTDKKPLKGVNILFNDRGTVSDKNGEFSIKEEITEKIQFSHIGYDDLILNKNAFYQILEKNFEFYLIPKVIEVEGISVTAELYDKSLLQTAKSISVFTEDRIRQGADIHLQTLLDEVPNINWAGGSSRPRYFQIRGIGERSNFFGEGPPNFSIGFSLDDMDLSGLGMLGHLFDLNQIEIYKGPQSTIFGSNAIGGLISIKSNNPADKFDIKTSLNVGSDNLKSISSMLNLKPFKNLSLRVSGSYNYSDGFRKNKSLNISNSNKREESFNRLKAKLFISEDIRFLGTFIYANFANGYDVWSPDNNQSYNTYTDSTGEDSQFTKGFSLRSELRFLDKIDITAISAYTETDLVHAYDGDWGDSTYWAVNHNFIESNEGWAYSFFDKNERNRKNLTNEIRLRYLNATFGIYHKNLDEKDRASGYLFGGAATSAKSKYEHNVYAVYGEFEYRLSNNLSFNSSFRQENSQYIFSGESQAINYYYEAVDLPDVFFKSDVQMDGHKVSLNYNLSKNTNIFASRSKGFKAGGINQQPSLNESSRPFEPEYLYNTEFGFKFRTSKTNTSFTMFDGIRKNQQVSISSQQEQGNPNSFLFYTDNATSGTIRGFEFENDVMVFENFIVSTSFGYLNTYINKFYYPTEEGDLSTFGGDREAAMSPNTASISIEYKMKNDIYFSYRTNFKSQYYFSDSHNQKSDSYSISNINISKSFVRVKLTFWGNNIFNTSFTTRGFYFGLIPPEYKEQLFRSYGDPKQIGIKIDYSFK